MKQKLSIFTSFIFTFFIASSCVFSGPSIRGNGKVEKQNRTVGNFEKINVSRGMNVYISQGEFKKIAVQADENLLDIIETYVEDDVLYIKAKENIRSAKSKKVFVSVPQLSEIKSSSGSNVFSENVLKSEKLKLSSSSGSNIKIKVKTVNLYVSTSSGSNAKLEGIAENFSGDASSGSNIKAKELKSEKCSCTVSSGANIWISTKASLKANASSGGNIFYYGNPKTTDINKSSGGNVINK